VTGRRGRRCWKLLDDLKKKRTYSHVKEVARDRTARMWRARFGRGFGPVMRQTNIRIVCWLGIYAFNRTYVSVGLQLLDYLTRL
jgi:hypothetical protein